MRNRTILVVDEDSAVRDLFTGLLESHGYTVLTCENGDSAVTSVEEHDVFAAFVDIHSPNLEGVETLRRIKEISENTEVVMITGYTQHEVVNEAIRLGCFVCMMKPFSPRDILGVLDVLEAGTDDMMAA